MAEIGFQGVSKRFPDGTAAVSDFDLTVGDGEFMLFVGPSGCGKTTALRMVAGLEELTEGEITLGSHSITNQPPGSRDIAMVFQNYALYPHMSVRANLAFPLKMQRAGKEATAARVAETARLLGLGELLDRRPRELSGGQRQRVAMGRAIVRRPQAFLMDEPLSNLDAKLRVQMRAELAKLHRELGITTVYVTHDQTEAMTLGDRVTVINGGRIQQVASPQELYDRPKNRFVAGFVGSPPMAFAPAVIEESAIVLGGYSQATSSSRLAEITVRRGPVVLGIRPEGVTLTSGPSGDGLAGVVEYVEHLGSDAYAYVSIDGLEIVVDEGTTSAAVLPTLCARVPARTTLSPGDKVTATLDGHHLHCFDPDTGAALASWA